MEWNHIRHIVLSLTLNLLCLHFFCCCTCFISLLVFFVVVVVSVKNIYTKTWKISRFLTFCSSEVHHFSHTIGIFFFYKFNGLSKKLDKYVENGISALKKTYIIFI